MAYIISDDCTACGECLRACPNAAVAEGLPVYRINRYLCTECLGFADEPQCAEACPVGAILPAWNLPVIPA